MAQTVDELLRSKDGRELYYLLYSSPGALRQLTRDQIEEIERRREDDDFFYGQIRQLLGSGTSATPAPQQPRPQPAAAAPKPKLAAAPQPQIELPEPPAQPTIAALTAQLDSFAGASIREFDEKFGNLEHSDRHAFGKARAAFAQRLVQQLPEKIKTETDLAAIRTMLRDLRAAAAEGKFKGTWDGFMLRFEPCEIDADLDEILIEALIRCGHASGAAARELQQQIAAQDFESAEDYEQAINELESLLRDIFESEE